MGIMTSTTLASPAAAAPIMWPVPEPAAIVGIDVSAARLDCYRLDTNEHWPVANTELGWADLVARLTADPPALIVLEATGKRERGVVRALEGVGMTPAVVNPLAVRRFKEGLGKRAKTDRGDARILALFGERMRPTPIPVSPVSMEELQELVARRTQLVKLRTQETNRRGTVSALTLASIDRLGDEVAKEIATIDAVIQERIDVAPAWRAKAARLMTVPGIGFVTAVRLIAGLAELGTTTRKVLAALVRGAPYAADSGIVEGRRSIAGGRHHLRHALYYATESVVQWEPTMRAHYQQLLARGKRHKQAIIACLNRLLGILNVMERDGLNWNQTNVGTGVFLPPVA